MNAGDETSGDAASVRTVLADGDPLARRTIRDTFQRNGITVVAEATTGREALELATFYRPDVVVMDERMPELDGIEVTRRLHERSPGICVILLSSAPDDERALRCLR